MVVKKQDPWLLRKHTLIVHIHCSRTPGAFLQPVYLLGVSATGFPTLSTTSGPQLWQYKKQRKKKKQGKGTADMLLQHSFPNDFRITVKKRLYRQ